MIPDDGREISTHQHIFDLSHDHGAYFAFSPQVKRLPDGSWEAFYPGQKKGISGETAEAAKKALSDHFRNELGNHNKHWQAEAVRKHLREEPVPGVYIFDADKHKRLRDSGFSREVEQEIMAEMRASGEAVDNLGSPHD